MKPLTRRDRRALLLGGAAVAAAVLAFKVAPWGARELHALRKEVELRGELLARMEADVGQADALGDSAAAVRAELLELAPKILTGGTEAEAVADLTTRLGGVAGSHRAVLKRADPIPDSTGVGWLRRVTLHAVLESDAAGAIGVVQVLERDPVVLTLGELRMVAPDPHSPDQVPEVVTLEVTVSGWYLAERRPEREEP